MSFDHDPIDDIVTETLLDRAKMESMAMFAVIANLAAARTADGLAGLRLTARDGIIIITATNEDGEEISGTGGDFHDAFGDLQEALAKATEEDANEGEEWRHE